MVYLSPTANTSFLWLIVPIAFGNFYQATTFSQTQGVVELRMRSVAAAILLFIINIIGLGIGKETAKRMIDNGAKVALWDYNEDTLNIIQRVRGKFSISFSGCLR